MKPANVITLLLLNNTLTAVTFLYFQINLDVGGSKGLENIIICHSRLFMWKHVCYITVCITAQAMTTITHTYSEPAAVIFILGFVIYRSGRKLNITAQSHRKRVSNDPLQLILTLI